MRSLLLAGIAAFGFSIFTTGCGGSSASGPAKAAEGPADSEAKPAHKPRIPPKK